MIDLLPGDIGLSRNSGWLSKSIRFFESLHTNKARWSHAWGSIGKGLIIESLSTVRINRFEKYDSPNQECVVYRVPLTEDDRLNFESNMPLKAAGAYGWGKIPLFALDGIFTGISKVFGRKRPVFFFTKTFGLFNIPVCSQLIVWGLHTYTAYELKNEFQEKVDWRIVSPDYLEDLLKLPHNNATKIYEKEKETVKIDAIPQVA